MPSFSSFLTIILSFLLDQSHYYTNMFHFPSLRTETKQTSKKASMQAANKQTELFPAHTPQSCLALFSPLLGAVRGNSSSESFSLISSHSLLNLKTALSRWAVTSVARSCGQSSSSLCLWCEVPSPHVQTPHATVLLWFNGHSLFISLSVVLWCFGIYRHIFKLSMYSLDQDPIEVL